MEYAAPAIGFLIGIAMLLIIRFLGTISADDKKSQPTKKEKKLSAPPLMINGRMYAPVEEKKKDEQPKPRTSAFGVRLE